MIMRKVIAVKNGLSATIFFFFNHRFKIQNSVCNSCHDLTMLCFNISNIAIIAVKGVDYRCIILDISKSEVGTKIYN